MPFLLNSDSWRGAARSLARSRGEEKNASGERQGRRRERERAIHFFSHARKRARPFVLLATDFF